jgi:hypothetical protein
MAGQSRAGRAEQADRQVGEQAVMQTDSQGIAGRMQVGRQLCRLGRKSSKANRQGKSARLTGNSE